MASLRIVTLSLLFLPTAALSVGHLNFISASSSAKSSTSKNSFPAGPIERELTPCCRDRLATNTCLRLRKKQSAWFEGQCRTSADFALVQCCRSCFDGEHRPGNATVLYEAIVRQFITTPKKNGCVDRRSADFCGKFVHRAAFWETAPGHSKLSCGHFPFAWRLCPASCGYCSTQKRATKIKYDLSIAMDAKRCRTRDFFARLGDIDSELPESLSKRITQSIRVLKTSTTRMTSERPSTVSSTATTTSASTSSSKAPVTWTNIVASSTNSPLEELQQKVAGIHEKPYEVDDPFFDPLAPILPLLEGARPDDYFVVRDHDYDVSASNFFTARPVVNRRIPDRGPSVSEKLVGRRRQHHRRRNTTKNANNSTFSTAKPTGISVMNYIMRYYERG